jgi:tetrahydromethanopterin S-methyltransferase subunit C
MIYEIRRFDLGSVFKITFLVSLVVALILGIFFGMFILRMIATISPMIQDEMPMDVTKVAGAGVIFLIGFLAVAMALQWSVMAVIAAAVYNVLAGSIGGLRMELSEPAPRHLVSAVPVVTPQPPISIIPPGPP